MIETALVDIDQTDSLVLLQLTMEQLALVSGGMSTGLDSGLPAPQASGGGAVTNGRQVLVDRAYRK